jgi:carboxylesterase type B
VKFAETGDPNGADLPTWPSYRKQKQFLNIGDSAGIGMSLKQRQLDVHDHANQQLYE